MEIINIAFPGENYIGIYYRKKKINYKSYVDLLKTFFPGEVMFIISI